MRCWWSRATDYGRSDHESGTVFDLKLRNVSLIEEAFRSGAWVASEEEHGLSIAGHSRVDERWALLVAGARDNG